MSKILYNRETLPIGELLTRANVKKLQKALGWKWHFLIVFRMLWLRDAKSLDEPNEPAFFAEIDREGIRIQREEIR